MSILFRQVAPADVDARASTAAGDGLTSARSGRRAVFVVRAFDRFGNSVAAPPEAPGMTGFRAEVTGSQVGTAFCQIKLLPVTSPRNA